MPDWKKIVQEHLPAAVLQTAKALEVVAELAGHLEETYEDARSRGMTEADAMKFALQEVNDWNILAKQIGRAKSEEDKMNTRTRSLWLPAMANVIAAPGLLMILQKLAVQPRIIWIGSFAMVLYWPWLAALPIFGALGAFVAKRAQSGLLNRLIVGLSPALAVLGAFAVLLPVSLVVDHPTRFPFGHFALGLALMICNWVLLPAFALLVGTVPFLGDQPAPRVASR